MTPVDLRSDTVTRPDRRMRAAMAEAEVGDDVWGDDPTVNRLQERAAALFGCEASLFFPSGCMANLTAVLAHAPAGSEMVCEADSHMYNFELAAAARLGGVQAFPVPTPDGILDARAVAAAIRPADPHLPRTGLVAVENTHNMKGGRVMPIATLREIAAVCRERGVPLHLDGARIFNASVAEGTPLAEYGRVADTIMFCLSKGLGAPVGSMLAGRTETIERCRQLRKMLGGGMRQVGVLAAPGLVALDNVNELATDHERARRIAEGLAAIPGVELLYPVETNLLFFRLRDGGRPLDRVVRDLAREGVLAGEIAGRAVRFVTHRDLPADAVERTLAACRRVLA